MSQIKIKINYNGDKLAMVVPYSIPYAQLLDRIERKVRIAGNGPEVSPTAPVRIRYQDEDGDFISMNSDDDVLMAFDIAYEGAVKDSQGTFGAVTLYVQVG
jgi:cell division control protein 24